MFANVLAAAGPGFEAPGVDEFYPKPLGTFSLLGIDFEITRITVISWIAVIAVLALFVAASRKPKLVPGRLQFIGESGYGFVRDGVSVEIMGRQVGLKFAPYLATLFFFILANNLMGIIPFAQIAPTSKIAIPAFLAAISYIMFNWMGIKHHGVAGYFKSILFPPGVPKPLYILVTPIELASTLIFRPFTLAVRLFANMMAGHLLLAVFALGATYLIGVGNYSAVFSVPSGLMSIVMTLFELLIEALQAYVFTVLTAVYIQGAMADEH